VAEYRDDFTGRQVQREAEREAGRHGLQLLGRLGLGLALVFDDPTVMRGALLELW
jgi:hypothetical protein